jgi:ubiquinone/menaquinone biosynthesis C-methylase UbiE
VKGDVEFARRMDRATRLSERFWPGRIRGELVASLTGTVLDVGAGTGANLRHFRSARHVVALEPDPAMREFLRSHLPRSPNPATVVAATAERLPFADGTFEACVCALVLCSVTDLPGSLAELHRVLKPGGMLVYLEHVRANGWWGRVQDRLDARWGAGAGGCHINRDIAAAIDEAGFAPVHHKRIRPLLNSPLSAPLIRGAAVRT